nr:MAG TPA: hypothetical protein [Caudoviricetes sp.]
MVAYHKALLMSMFCDLLLQPERVINGTAETHKSLFSGGIYYAEIQF